MNSFNLSKIRQLATLRRQLAPPRQQLLPLNGGDVSPQCAIRDDLATRAELLRSDLKLEREFGRQLLLAQAALELQRELFDHADTCPICQRIELEEAG